MINDARQHAMTFGPALDWEQPADLLANLVNSLQTQVLAKGRSAGPAVAVMAGRPIGIVSAASGGIHSPYAAGTVIRRDDQVWIQTGTGHLAIGEVLCEDGSTGAAAEVFRSAGIQVGDRFDPARTVAAAIRAA